MPRRASSDEAETAFRPTGPTGALPVERIGLLGLVGLALLSVGACTTTRGPGGLAAGPSYFPLEPGNFWVYEVRHPRGQVELQRVLVRGPHYLESQAIASTIVTESGGGYGELALDTRWHPVAYYRRGDFVYKVAGLHYDDEASLREFELARGEEKVLPTSFREHESWGSEVDLFLAGDGAYRLRTLSRARAESEAVKVHAGTFRDCVRVDTVTVSRSRRGPETSSMAFAYVDWYAPDVGLVKSEVRLPEEERALSSIELLSFRRGPSPTP